MRLYSDPRRRREFPDEEWYGDTEALRRAARDWPEGDSDHGVDVDVDAWLESDDWDELAELAESAPAGMPTPGEDAEDAWSPQRRSSTAVVERAADAATGSQGKPSRPL